jgi:hypothetical protein
MPIRQRAQALAKFINNPVLPGSDQRDAYFLDALNRYLEETRALTREDMDAFLRQFASARAEQAKNLAVLHKPSCDALRRSLDLAQKLAALRIAHEPDPLRTEWIIELMLAVCDMDDWVTQGKHERRFDADLSVGDTAAVIGILYMLMREDCAEPQRERIAQSLWEKGIKPICAEWLDPDTHWHALDTMGHNWWLVIVCGAGIAMLAVRHDLPLHGEMMESILEGARQWFRYPGNVLQNKKANFGPDGDFIEFIGYLTYGLSNYALFEDMHRRLYGKSDVFESEKLEPLPDYYMTHYMEIGGVIQLANFGDTPQRHTKHQHALYMLASWFQRGDFFHCVRRASPGPNQLPDFLYYPAIDGLAPSETIRAPRFAIYRHAGYAAMRTGFGSADTFFAIKTGESWNHNHLDVGTFILSSKGKAIAVDSGTCAYHRPEYQDYYRAPAAHNVVLFNGQGEAAETILTGTKFSGTFPSHLNAERRGFRYLLADCCGAYTNIYERFYRHILFLDGAILFVDDVQTREPGTLDWRMHFDGSLTREGSDIVLNAEGTQTRLCPLYPPGQRLAIEKAWRTELNRGEPHGVLPESQCLSLRSDMKDCRAKLIQLILLPGTQASARVDSDGAMIKITLEREELTETIYCNTLADGRVMHKNSNIVMDALETDAFLVYHKATEDILTDIAMINGSRLLMNGGMMCGSMIKLDAHLHIEDRTYTASLCMDATVYLTSPNGARRVCVAKGHTEGSW